MKDEAGEANKGRDERKGIAGRTGVAIGWVLGAALGVYLFGFLVAIALFVFAYLKQRGRGWTAAVITAAVTTVLIFGIFQYALEFELYEGLIYNLLVG